MTPRFSSGPCAKRPGWTPEALKDAALGRSHRAKVGKAKLKLAIDLTREVLGVPADYRIGITPGSDTGAVEMALWSLLGARARRRARLGKLRRRLGHRRRQATEARRRAHAEGALRRAARSRARSISTTTSSSPGTAPPRACACPNADWIPADRKGLTICDATSAAFAQDLDWPKLDVVDLLLAEGARRRGRARHDHPEPARGRAARDLQAGLAAAQGLPHDQGRQADRRHLRGRDDQHALDAVRRGLYRRAAMGQERSAASRR